MPKHNVRWLHLSDFHVGKDTYAQRRMFERIVEHVSSQRSVGIIPDFVFITGDIADKARPDEYELFNLEFLTPLQDAIGGTIKERTFAVPGNHDVDRNKHQAFDRKIMVAPDSRYFDPTEEGLALREILLPRFQPFAENDWTTTQGAWCKARDGSYTKIEEIRGTKVGICGINTAWLSKEERESEHLTPGKALVEDALKNLQNAHIRIVLGHHPINWYVPSEKKAIGSILGKYSVIYLHGHLHEAWCAPEYGGANRYLTVQCGAAFQAREGEKWKNGIIWADLDADEQILSLQPRNWNAIHQDWALASDAFPDQRRKNDYWVFPLPGSPSLLKQLAAATATTAVPGVPKGWFVSAFTDLTTHVVPLETGEAVRYFNGAVPGWHVALSSSIPRRSIVEKLCRHLESKTTDQKRTNVALLLAAACEGKTTALLQAAFEYVRKNPSWKILRRGDETQTIDIPALLSLIISEQNWLVVIDEADGAAGAIVSLLSQLPDASRKNISLLMACRDTDWHASGAYTLQWGKYAFLLEERLSGLTEKDATSLVSAWTEYGDEGLGALASAPAEERTKMLVEAARREAEVPQGALFGALLTVRLGRDLHKHARLLLDQLATRKIKSGGSLQDALAYIAALHAEGLECLSRPVLATVLNCPLEKLRQDVVAPLSGEAAATTTSSFVLTRHRLIAKAVVEVLGNELGQDVDHLYVRLVEAAVDSASTGQFIPNFAFWRFGLPEHFFSAGNPQLAIEIARATLKRNPLDAQMLVKVTQFYRKAGDPETAVKLFREFPPHVDVPRGFFSEWATSEGIINECGNSVALSTFSLADQSAFLPPTRDDVIINCGCLGISFSKLYRDYSEEPFLDGLAAAGVLGTHLTTESTDFYFPQFLRDAEQMGANIPSSSVAIKNFQHAASLAEDYLSSEKVSNRVGRIDRLTFKNLDRVIHATTRKIARQPDA